MIRLKFLLALFIGTFSYTLISFVTGQNGILCFNQLSDQKIEIAKRTNEIEKINTELNLEYTALLKDRDVISAYAKKLDYVHSDEKIIKINGLKPYQNTLFDIGSVLKRKECIYISEEFCKICGVFFFTFSIVIMFVIDIKHGKISFRKKEYTNVQGIPIYDVQQI